MLSAARAAGFAAAFAVDFPHATPAKKYSICLHKGQRGAWTAAKAAHGAASGSGGGSSGEWRSCCLAWPRRGTCVLAWERHLSASGLDTEGLAPAVARLQRQHAVAGKHVLRLHRRADAVLAARSAAAAGVAGGGERREQQPQPPLEQQQQQQQGGLDAGAGGAGAPQQQAPAAAEPVVLVEAEVEALSLQPCGGAIFVQLAGPQRLLAEATSPRDWLAAAAGGGCGCGARLLSSRVSLLEGEAAALHRRPRVAPHPPAAFEVAAAMAAHHDSGDPAALRAERKPKGSWCHMLVEPLALELGNCAGDSKPSGGSGGGGKLVCAGVLHAHKGAQHLALSTTAACLQAAAAEAATGLGGLCRELDAALVAADALVHVGDGATDVAWLLYVPDLQQMDRRELVATVQRHLPWRAG